MWPSAKKWENEEDKQQNAPKQTAQLDHLNFQVN
jgi:hypothetical protein